MYCLVFVLLFAIITMMIIIVISKAPSWQSPILGISVIDQQPQTSNGLNQFRANCLKGDDFENKLKPSDIKLSSAMAMSAAALSPYLGRYEMEEQKFTHMLSLLGMEMAANLVSNMAGERKSGCCHRVSCCLVITRISLLIRRGWFFYDQIVSVAMLSLLLMLIGNDSEFSNCSSKHLLLVTPSWKMRAFISLSQYFNEWQNSIEPASQSVSQTVHFITFTSQFMFGIALTESDISQAS